MDNTRILAARKAGIYIQARTRSLDEALTAAEVERFTVKGFNTPKTWGDVIKIRIQKQTGGYKVKFPYNSWGDRFPYGSLYDPKVK
ncbi:MAG: hypothetical protein OEM02_16075 [Desulfobulbaceae bacterium]|nr:hypothetical protein [Desulfobulbaceae bacterium]